MNRAVRMPGDPDPDATQAIGLHRADEPPTWRTPMVQRTARGGFRAFAAVLPWNWRRRQAVR